MPPKKRPYKEEEDHEEDKENNAELIPKKLAKKSSKTNMTAAAATATTTPAVLIDAPKEMRTCGHVGCSKEDLCKKVDNVVCTKIGCIHPIFDDDDDDEWQDFSIAEYNLKFNSDKIFTPLDSYQFFVYKAKPLSYSYYQTYDDKYYLFVAALSNSESTFESVPIVPIDLIQRHLLDLFARGCLRLSVSSIAKGEIQLDIALTKKLNQPNLTALPSDYYKHEIHCGAIRNVMNQLYFCKQQRQSTMPGLKALTQRFLYDDRQQEGCRGYREVTRSDDDYKSAQEILFELVHSINNKFEDLGASDREIDVIQERSCLLPVLRKYQINAIKWMLHKENFNFESIGLARGDAAKSSSIIKSESNPAAASEQEEELHTLFVKVVNKDSRIVYFHKYFGLFTTVAPLRQRSHSGGILADEMGLGKTLEVLATILINRFTLQTHDLIESSIQRKLNADKHQQKTASNEDQKKSKAFLTSGFDKVFSCVCGQRPDDFKDKVGSEESFICLACHEKIPPLKSTCTLIVTPSIISKQWIDEIKKHLNNKKLKILFYTGVTHLFIQPRDLAQLDICITTYDVLNEELAHVFSLDDAMVLRRPKRFANVSSPLLYVEWWRVCLDEAQMVHTTNSRCADMANRLNAVNRWCITGTPIGRSLSDLHGLFKFIRQDPYCEKRWFDELLFDPFNSAKDKMPMALEVSKCLWRTTRKHVKTQIQLPAMSEKVYRLTFSPFESHLYERVRADTRLAYEALRVEVVGGRVKKIHDYNPNLRLDELDRIILNTMLAPLLDLRITCDHPQLILRKSHFMEQSKEKRDKLLTMEASLQLMIKKYSDEAQKLRQSLLTGSIKIARVIFEQGKYEEAVKLYQGFLDSENVLKDHSISISNMQLISLLSNFIEAQQKLDEKSTTANNVASLEIKLSECESKQLKSFRENKLKDESVLKRMLEADPLLLQVSDCIQTHVGRLESILDKVEGKSSKSDADFMRRLMTTNKKVQIQENGIVVENVCVFGQVVKNVVQVKSALSSGLKRLLENRTNTIDLVLSFFDVKSKLVTKHTNLTCFHRQNLWNTGITKEIVAKATECHLSKVNQPSSSKTKTKTKTKDCSLCQVEQSLNERTQLFDLALDLETVLEAASEQLGHRGDFDYMRQLCVDLTDEHYQLIKYFQATSSLIKAQSEVEAAKSQTQTTTTTITQHDLKLQQTQQKSMELQFRKKLNQIIYLKNLEKTYKMKDGEENRDECPICKEFFGFEWFILSCGHLLCKDCNTTMLEAGDPRQGHLNCVICREVCKHSDSYLVSTRINNKKTMMLKKS
jgi:SNF2 family DNA or RNA helicase